MSDSRNLHVVKRGDAWASIREGGERHTILGSTQAEAISAARVTAQRDGVELIIHRPNGEIRARDSYGNDPFPPRG